MTPVRQTDRAFGLMFGSAVIIFALAARFEIRNGDPLYKQLRLKIVELMVAHDVDVIDPYPEFKQAGFQPTHFAHDGHWSPLGHEVAGKAAAKWVSHRFAN